MRSCVLLAALLAAGLTAILIGDDDLPEGALRVSGWSEIPVLLGAHPSR